MTETAQQYAQRILGYVDGKPPLAVQAATATTLERLIAGVPVDRLRTRPAPGKWSVNDIVAHLADGEIVRGLARFILGLRAPIVAYIRIDGSRAATTTSATPKSLEQFHVREANLPARIVEPAQWQHYGVHSNAAPIDRAHRAHVRRARHQSPAADREDPWEG
jgi:hypothetical protein